MALFLRDGGLESPCKWPFRSVICIRGTVQVEGTVEVTGKVQVEGGTVQVEGAANKESLLKRGWILLGDRNWAEAKRCFERSLDIDPEYAEAYLGLCMADLQVSERTSLSHTSPRFKLPRDKNYINAIRIGSDALKAELKEYHRIQRQNAEESERKYEEHLAREQAEREANIERLRSVREKWAAFARRISAEGGNTVAVKSDGTVLAVGNNQWNKNCVSDWTDIIAVSTDNVTLGLRDDGTVVVTGDKHDVSSWRNIAAVFVSNSDLVGLRRDGTAIHMGIVGDLKNDISEWTGAYRYLS